MMHRVSLFALAAVVAGTMVSAPVSAADKEKKDRLTLKAQRAGWMMGMYIGEQKSQPHPFVLKVDPDGDAAKKGIRAGDELIRFDGLETDPLWRVFERANEVRPGKEIQLWFRRGVQTIRVSLTVPKAPGQEPSEKVEDDAKKKDKQADSENSAEDKKKKKKKPPVVIKPIPAPGGEGL